MRGGEELGMWRGERTYHKDKEVDGLWPQKVKHKSAMTRR